MAELTTDSTETTSSCCSPAAQETCCEPSDKDACCGTAAAGQECGCAEGQASIADSRAVREKVRGFVQEHCVPAERELERRPYKEVLGELREKARAQGLWCPFVPKEWGGMGLGPLANALVQMELGESYLGALALNTQGPDDATMLTLLTHGTEFQREKFLKPLLAGAAEGRDTRRPQGPWESARPRPRWRHTACADGIASYCELKSPRLWRPRPMLTRKSAICLRPCRRKNSAKCW